MKQFLITPGNLIARFSLKKSSDLFTSSPVRCAGNPRYSTSVFNFFGNRKAVLFALLFMIALSSFAQNKTYYVSPSGNDSHSGLSANTAWKTTSKVSAFDFEPGDKILFEGGQTFFGDLYFEAEDGPFSVNSYGIGRATINAGSSNAIYAYNVGNIDIQNLILVGAGVGNASNNGVFFYMDQNAGLSDVVIDNTEIYGFSEAGIMLGAWGTSYGYNNVRITNNTVHDNGTIGITSYGNEDMYNHKNFYVAFNKTYNNLGRLDITYTNTGSGIVLAGINGFTIEYCEAYGNGANNRNNGGGPVGIWCYNTKNGVIQYCESHHNKAGLRSDGGGFDIDGGSQNCVLQYNYSHDNEGPGFAFFEYGSSNKFLNDTIRYNISENDGLKNSYGSLTFWSYSSSNKITNSVVYNNVFYASNPRIGATMYLMNNNLNNVKVYNNIFYSAGVPILKGSSANVTWQKNNYYSTAKINFSQGGTTVNPGFINPGGGKDGYKLLSNSPLIDSGLSNNSLKDFYGKATPQGSAHDIGAYEAPQNSIASSFTYYRDADGDGYGTTSDSIVAVIAPQGYVVKEGDCNDNNANIYPEAAEISNGIDDNCNGIIDEGLEKYTYYKDADGDGYGTNSDSVVAAIAKAGYVIKGGDCLDNNANIYPGGVEIANGIDDNCNGIIDEGLEKFTYYRDADGDGYGINSDTVIAAIAPAEYVINGGDLVDNNANIYPGAVEISNGIDDNCNGIIDEGLEKFTCYRDTDEDGYGTNSDTVIAAVVPAGYVIKGGDSVDNNPGIYPGAAEIANGIDDNCNGIIDENLEKQTYYRDVDGDDYGRDNESIVAVAARSGYVLKKGDCVDWDRTINPGAAEIANGKDDNCNGLIDEGLEKLTYYKDVDGDGYGRNSDSIISAIERKGYVLKKGDCVDWDRTINPGAIEILNGKDDNCNGLIDEAVKSGTASRTANFNSVPE